MVKRKSKELVKKKKADDKMRDDDYLFSREDEAEMKETEEQE